MFAFIKNSFFGIISILCRLVSSFCLNKIVALYFGPAGLVQLAQLQNLLTFFTLIPNDGINRGLIKLLSQFRQDSKHYKQYFFAGLVLTILHFGLACGVILLAKNFTLAYFPSSSRWFAPFLGGVLLLLAQAFLSAVLLARQLPAKVVISHIISAVGVVLFVFFAGSYFTLPQLFSGYILLQGSSVLYLVYYTFKGQELSSVWIGYIPPGVYRQLGNYILMAVSVLIFSKGVEFVVRDYMISRFTLPEAGLWQGVVRLSDSYSGVFTAVLAFAFFPKVVTLVAQPILLQRFVRSTLRLVIPILLLSLLGIYLARTLLISGLFSKQFLKGSYLVNYQLLGDFFKLSSWLLANILVAQANLKIIVWFEGISAAAYLGFVYFFTNRYGLAGSTMAHSANYAFFLVLHVFYFRKLLFK